MENNKRRQKGKQTPIVDGDARPDIDLNPEDKPKKGIVQSKDEGKTTHYRADRNALEDFRDGK